MPDRSYPGVYIEEFGPAKAIAGVATFIVGVLVGVAVSLVLDRLRRQCKQTQTCFRRLAPERRN